jgi:hypothetical protein
MDPQVKHGSAPWQYTGLPIDEAGEMSVAEIVKISRAPLAPASVGVDADECRWSGA